MRAGQLVQVEARLAYTGNSSMALAIEVHANELSNPQSRLVTHCVAVYVAVDENDRPIAVDTWRAETPGDMALAQRVHDLEREVHLTQLARAAPPTPMEAFPPRFIAYPPDPPPPPPMYSGCDPSWAGCGWNTGYFPSTIVVIGASNHRRAPAYRGERERNVGPVRPMRGLPSSPRRR